MTGVKIILKTKKNGTFVDYEAKIGDAVEMSGYTRGGKDEVKQIIRRALRAEKPLPNRVIFLVAKCPFVHRGPVSSITAGHFSEPPNPDITSQQVLSCDEFLNIAVNLPYPDVYVARLYAPLL